MKHCTIDQLVAFEERIRDLFAAGELPYLIHLSGGNEERLTKIFERVQPGDWVFSGHRSHYHYLLSGGKPEDLERMIREGKSMFVFGRPETVPGPGLAESGLTLGLQVNFLTSSVLAGLCGAAAGVAWDLKASGSPNRVWCFVGDGAEDEGHFYEAVRFVDGWELPCEFIIEDNDRSVDTIKSLRRGGRSLASEFRWPSCVRRYLYTATWPHGGAGLTTLVEFKPEAVKRAKERNG